MQANKDGSHLNWQSFLVYNVTDLAAYLPASKIWILRFRHCVAVDNLLKNMSPKYTCGASPSALPIPFTEIHF